MANPGYFTILASVLCLALLMGCTVNPQDLAPAPRPGGSGGTGGLGGTGGNTSSNQSGQTVILTMAEVAKHNSAYDCWMVINNEVLDLTYFTSHPGGSTYIPYCGTDGTAAYDAIRGGNGHSSYATSMFADYLVGVLGQPVSVNATIAVKNATQQSQPGGRDYEDD